MKSFNDRKVGERVRGAKAVIAGVLLALAGAGSAAAQDVGVQFARDRNITVLGRDRPEYDALGLREGDFTIYPRLTVGVSGDDNVLAANDDKKADVYGSALGYVSVQSNWDHNSLSGFARIGRDQYAEQSSEDKNTYGFGSAGQYDLSPDAAIAASAAYEHLVEPRTYEGAPASIGRPVRYDQTSFTLSGAQAFDRYRVRASVDYEHYVYFDTIDNTGAPLSQTFRDNDEILGKVRAEDAISPNTSVFFEVVSDTRNYRVGPSTPASFDRNSQGEQFNGGINFDLTHLARGELNVGYLHQVSADPRIPDYNGPVANTQVQFFPSSLTTVTLNVNRLLGESGEPQTPILVSTGAVAKVDHELLRNLILSANIGFTYDTYPGLERKDDRFSTGASGYYLVSRNLGLKLDYSFQQLRSSGPQSPAAYDINRISLSAILQY